MNTDQTTETSVPPIPQPADPAPTRSRRYFWPTVLILLALEGVGAIVLQRLPAIEISLHPTVAAIPVMEKFETTFAASGASFPYPLYSKLFDEYHALRPGVQVHYASVGSGAGVRQFGEGATDFGASDAPMTDEQMKTAKGGEVLHVPMTLGAVVPVYNLPGVGPTPLVFSGTVLADVFRGQVTRWNDPAIAELNPGVTLPGDEITVVHRADGSGTTYVFTDYLCKVSPEFAAGVGRGTTVSWPAARKAGAPGSEGVSAKVAKTVGTIGYVELTYALQHGIAFGAVVNAAGRPVHASLDSVTVAAASLPTPPPDLRMSITNAPGDDAYPIAAFSYLLIYRNQADRAKANALADFLTWAVTDGQRLAPPLHYAPLPPDVTALNQMLIQSIRVNGRHFALAQ